MRVGGRECFAVKFSGRLTGAGRGVVLKTSNDCGTSSEDSVSDDSSWACWRARRNAELVERAEKSNVEVSVLSHCEGRVRRLYLCSGMKYELVESWDCGLFTGEVSKRFDSEVDCFRIGWRSGEIFDVLKVFKSEGKRNKKNCEYSVSGICIKFSWGWRRGVFIAVGCF